MTVKKTIETPDAARIVRADTAYAYLMDQMLASLAKLEHVGQWDGDNSAKGIDLLYSLGHYTMGQLLDCAQDAARTYVGEPVEIH